MGKKKRFKKITVYGVLEGTKDERNFLEYLQALYSDTKKVHITLDPKGGGSPDHLLETALKNTDRNRCFVWMDEDEDLTPESRKTLAKCWKVKEIVCPLKNIHATHHNANNPLKFVIVISHPVCFEGFMLELLGKNNPHPVLIPANRDKQVQDLKNAFKSVIGTIKPSDFYEIHLLKATLETKRKAIPELDLLIKLISH